MTMIRPAGPRGRTWLGIALAVLAAVSVPATIAAAQSAPDLQIGAVDSRNGKLSVDYVYTGGRGAQRATLSSDGKRLKGTVSTLLGAGVASSVVVVLDTSAATGNAAVQLALEEMSALSPQKGAINVLGLVSTGGGAKIVVQPAADMAAVSKAAEVVVPTGKSAMWDGIGLAANMLATTGNTQRNVVVVTGSPDTASSSGFSAAVRNLTAVGGFAHVIQLPGAAPDAPALTDLVNRVGGSYQTGTDQNFHSTFSTIASRLSAQFRLTVSAPPALTSEYGTVTLAVGESTTKASYRPEVLAVGTEAVKPIVSEELSTQALMANSTMKYVIVGIAALSIAGVFFAVASLTTKRRDGLDDALRHYDEVYVAGSTTDSDEQSATKSAILQRAVAVTGTIAEESGFLDRVENLLERADLPLRAPEALTFYLGGAAASVVLAFLLSGSMTMVLVVVLVALILPGFVVDFLAKRRKKKFTALLPDMLQLLAGTLRAGYSIAQAMEAVSNEIEEPMGKELRRAVTEAQLGRPLEESLEAAAHRMDSADFEWAVMAIRIQREVGGNLAELLISVANTMVERERLRRDVASLTAEGRMSAIILGLLPPGLGVAMFAMNPEYIQKLFYGTGLILLFSSLVMMLIGFVWMKKTVTIEV